MAILQADKGRLFYRPMTEAALFILACFGAAIVFVTPQQTACSLPSHRTPLRIYWYAKRIQKF